MIPSSPHHNTNGKNNKNGGGSNNSNKKVATMRHPLAPGRSEPPVRPGAASLPTITFCRLIYNCCWHACVCVLLHTVSWLNSEVLCRRTPRVGLQTGDTTVEYDNIDPVM
jgi:hypothetical protein